MACGMVVWQVDLHRFRRMAVGDKLRAIYDQLSRDPNSLSNLDQDLPNYAQSMVPIFSLPQEWLWCETWCSDESKAKYVQPNGWMDGPTARGGGGREMTGRATP